jgi:hypothetical protein
VRDIAMLEMFFYGPPANQNRLPAAKSAKINAQL